MSDESRAVCQVSLTAHCHCGIEHSVSVRAHPQGQARRTRTRHTRARFPTPHLTPTNCLARPIACRPTVCASVRDAQPRTSAAADLSPFSRPHARSLAQASWSEQCSSVGPVMPSSRRLSSDGYSGPSTSTAPLSVQFSPRSCGSVPGAGSGSGSASGSGSGSGPGSAQEQGSAQESAQGSAPRKS